MAVLLAGFAAEACAGQLMLLLRCSAQQDFAPVAVLHYTCTKAHPFMSALLLQSVVALVKALGAAGQVQEVLRVVQEAVAQHAEHGSAAADPAPAPAAGAAVAGAESAIGGSLHGVSSFSSGSVGSVGVGVGGGGMPHLHLGYLFNAAISACAHAPKHSGELDRLVARMRELGAPPDERTYASLLSSCLAEQDVERARRLFDEMQLSGVQPGVHVLNMLAKVGGWVGGWECGVGGRGERGMVLLLFFACSSLCMPSFPMPPAVSIDCNPL
jgi:pentatricopeptide repeat protein